MLIQWYLWTVWRSGKRIELGLLCKCGLCSGCIYSITAPPYLAPFPFSHLENWDIGVSNNLQHYAISTKTCPPNFPLKHFPKKTWWSREGNNKHICPISPTRETYRDKWSNRYRYHDNDGFPKWSLIKESTFMNICFRVLSYLVSSIIVQQNRLCSILLKTHQFYIKQNTNETNRNTQLFEPD